jgi:hypothetical protein
MALRTAGDFFHAINEATRIKGVEDPSDDAIEFLADMSENVFRGLDTSGAHGRDRDNMIFWEAMLKGVQLRLAKDRLRDAQAARAADAIFKMPEGSSH